MKLEDFTYVVESQRSAREALVAVWKAAEATGWVILGDYDPSRMVAVPGSQLEVTTT